MIRDQLTIDLFRSSGRSLRRGTPARVPSLPRTRRGRTILKLEADRDPLVRLAYRAALDQAAQTKRRQLRPQTLRRTFGEILEIR